MSNHIISEVYKRQVGGLARTAVMLLLADKASDDGSGIWAAKQTMADELGATKQTILNTLKSLIADGLVREVGTRPCSRGYTVEYAIDVAALRALPLVPAHGGEAAKTQRHGTSTGQSRDCPVTSRAVTPVASLVTSRVTSQASHVTESDACDAGRGQRDLPHGSKTLTPRVKEIDPNPPRTPLEPFPSDTSYPQGASLRDTPRQNPSSIHHHLSTHFRHLPPAAQLVRWEEAFAKIGRNPSALASRELCAWREWLEAVWDESDEKAVAGHAMRLLDELTI